MEYVKLLKSDIKVSRLGFGCCPMGMHGWGDSTRQDLIEAVHIAFDRGVNFFDTSDIYGLGISEEILGKSLKGRRSDVVISTKFGVRRTSSGETFYDNSPEWMLSALDGSLRRLNVDHIDLYQLHYWDGKTRPEIIIEELEKARNMGKIRYYGVTNIDPSQWDLKPFPESLVSISYEFSLAKREFEDLIRALNDSFGLGFLSWGSLGQGVLSGRYNVDSKFPATDRRCRQEYINFNGDKLKKNLRIVNLMRKLQGKYNRTLCQIAVRWILDYLPFSIALVGIKRSEQLIDNIGALGWTLDQKDIQALEEISR